MKQTSITHTKQSFLEKANQANPHLSRDILMGEYYGVDARYKVQCPHGERYILGWQLLQPKKYCCHQDYIAKRQTPNKRSKKDWANVLDQCVINHNVKLTTVEKENHKKLKFMCHEHGWMTQWVTSIKTGIGCPRCVKEKEKLRKQKQAVVNFHENHSNPFSGNYISKSEIRWLDQLGISNRQVWLSDICYKVDGFDPDTNTVYLYHGRFWHGCPETYDPHIQHPIRTDYTMGELYKITKNTEQRILAAGYKLITEWGN